MAWDVEGVSSIPMEPSSPNSSNDGAVMEPGVIKVRRQGTMYMFYEKYLCKFGELLTDMERNGIKVN